MNRTSRRWLWSDFGVTAGTAPRRQRLAQFRRLAQEGVVVAGAHLPFPGIARVRAEDQGFAFVPVDPLDRDGL